MKINEIFTSIQGEGPFTGRRTVFIRLSGCNKACPWCDTKYASDTYFDITPREVYETVIRTGIDHVCITGGEPMLQEREVYELADLLSGHVVTLETNGSIKIETDHFTLVMCSPKTLEDAELQVGSRVTYKFVCAPDNVDSIMQWVVSNNVRDPYFMPLGSDIQTMMNHSLMIISKMEEYMINGSLCCRLQVLYGVK